MEHSFFYCDICNIQTSSEEQLRSHLLGQKHWYNKRQRETAQRSVFVRGLPPSPQVVEIEGLFQQFGNVNKVIIDEKGIYAIVEFTSIESSLAVLRCPQKLYLRGKVLIVKPREVKLKNKKSRKDSEEESLEVMEEPTREEGYQSQIELELRKEDVDRILSSQTLDEQIQMLASTQYLSSTFLEPHLQLLSYLQSQLQTVFPSCCVLPFGSLVTGVTTPTSDLDAVVLTDWTQEDDLWFGGDKYFRLPYSPHRSTSSDLSECVIISSPSSHLQTTPTLSHDNTIVSMDTSLADSNISSSSLLSSSPSLNSSLTTPTSHSLPSHVKICGSSLSISSYPKDYQVVLNVIGNLSECTRILALPSARCPIIHFTHEPTGLHCDLSVNTRFGPHNSRLIQAYLNFDSRVIPLILILRAWVRVMSIKRTQLNNYALSLMLIYALQKITPPVLPSLQSPGPWPRNMEWYGRRGFHVTEEMRAVKVEGWNGEFLNPALLLASENNMSLSELLLHFFHFYSNIFDFSTDAVAIHAPSNQQLSITEAMDMSSVHGPSNLPDKLLTMKVGCVCVQDPIELSHNVTKSLNHHTLSVLKGELARAYQIMQELHSPSAIDTIRSLGILSLFSSSDCVHKQPKTSDILHFTLTNICSLLSKVPVLNPLVETLPQLDLQSQYTINKLHLVVLRALVCILESDLGFNCLSQQPYLDMSPLLTTSTSLVPVIQEDNNTNIASIIVGPSLQSEAISDRKRQRSDDDEIPGISLEIEDINDFKKSKAQSSIGPISILEQYCRMDNESSFPSVVQCTAFTNSWTHRRKWKRQLVSNPAVATNDLTSNSTPILQFNLSIVNPSALTSAEQGGIKHHETVVRILVKVSDGDKSADEFPNFFAFFKKLILSPNQDFVKQ